MSILFEPIGVIHTPFYKPVGMPIQPAGAGDTLGTVELLPVYRPGLQDLDGFSHIILLYYLHRSQGFDLQVTPFLDSQPHGLFATRAPRRPNSIGLSVVRLRRVHDGVLYVTGVDMLDESPLLDIKPYVPDFDVPVATAVTVGWLEGRVQHAAGRKADARFQDKD